MRAPKSLLRLRARFYWRCIDRWNLQRLARVDDVNNTRAPLYPNGCTCGRGMQPDAHASDCGIRRR